MVIGKGGFGDVYKGILDDGQVVAIKKASSVERASTFDMELELLAQLNHKYLVNLVGYCEEDKCLVFEFMLNGSLQDCLFDKRSAQLFNWKGRMKVALQAARGIEYLHVYASPKIIHRDVKASNILLDEHWDAHISDFGLSLYGPVGIQTHISNLAPCGTPGYLDPEYFQTYQLNVKSDVYSFGVVLLELLSGRKALDADHSVYSIVLWAMELANQGKSIYILDLELKVTDDVEHRSLRSQSSFLQRVESPITSTIYIYSDDVSGKNSKQSVKGKFIMDTIVHPDLTYTALVAKLLLDKETVQSITDGSVVAMQAGWNTIIHALGQMMEVQDRHPELLKK
ncbi:hypothetical protein L7F22_024640 [Adiantum nelumboides]|nr:hypothetical protein [Adiantum nelumboides]